MSDIKDFHCCGGNDETPQDHTQDCEEFGNPKWLTRIHAEEVKQIQSSLDQANERIKTLEDDREILGLKLEKAVEALGIAKVGFFSIEVVIDSPHLKLNIENAKIHCKKRYEEIEQALKEIESKG